MSDLVDQLQREIERLTVKLADAQIEGRYLRKRLKENSRGGRILRRAHRDALYMLTLHFAGYDMSRRQSFALAEISERRWEWARALLILALVHNGTTIIAEHPEGALQKLDVAVKLVEKHGLDRLRVRKSDRDRLFKLRARGLIPQ